jgi:hypothetical protein
MLPTKFQFNWPISFRGEDFSKSTNQKQASPVVAMFVNGEMSNLYRGLPIDASYQVLVGSICGRFSKKILISFRFVIKHGLHHQFLFLIGRFLKIFSSETTRPNEPKLGRIASGGHVC